MWRFLKRHKVRDRSTKCWKRLTEIFVHELVGAFDKRCEKGGGGHWRVHTPYSR